MNARITNNNPYQGMPSDEFAAGDVHDESKALQYGQSVKELTESLKTAFRSAGENKLGAVDMADALKQALTAALPSQATQILNNLRTPPPRGFGEMSR